MLNAIDRALLNQSKAGTLFNCFYRGPDASIKNIQQTITTPTDITESLTYAVGYIDQGATYSQAIQRVRSRLQTVIYEEFEPELKHCRITKYWRRDTKQLPRQSVAITKLSSS